MFMYHCRRYVRTIHFHYFLSRLFSLKIMLFISYLFIYSIFVIKNKVGPSGFLVNIFMTVELIFSRRRSTIFAHISI